MKTSFFSETSQGKYVPRAVFVDLESTVIDEIRKSTFGNIFHPNQMICGGEDAANNYARGYFTIGQAIANETEEVLRKMTESCESLGGFFLTDFLMKLK